MSTFRTCKNCVLEKQPCARRDSLRASLAGLGVLSVKHVCKQRAPLFTVGQRVLTTWTVSPPDDNYGDYASEEDWPATVIAESGVRFLLKVDDVLSDHETPASEYFKNPSLYVKARAGKIKPLAEPAREVCATCGRVDRGPKGQGGCYASGTHHVPYACLGSEVPATAAPAKAEAPQ